MASSHKQQERYVIAAGLVIPVEEYQQTNQRPIFPEPQTIPQPQRPRQTLEDRMSGFIAQRLNLSNIYHISEQDRKHILVEIPREGEPIKVYVALHSGEVMTEKEFQELVKQNKSSGIYTGHIFLKDGKTFHIRLAEEGHYKRHQSLKRYAPQQRNAIIELRLLEKLALEFSKRLTYYQPSSAELLEGIRTYNMNPVIQDYSHRLVDEQRVRSFAGEGRLSRTWRLPKEILPQILSQAPAFLVLAPSTMQAFITAIQPQ